MIKKQFLISNLDKTMLFSNFIFCQIYLLDDKTKSIFNTLFWKKNSALIFDTLPQPSTLDDEPKFVFGKKYTDKKIPTYFHHSHISVLNV